MRPTIRQPGFDFPRQQWSLLNFRTEQGHCGASRRKRRLTDTDLCPCGETKTMSHIVESCPLTKLNGALSRLHSVDEDAVSWLTSYGSWHAYEKKKKHICHVEHGLKFLVYCTAVSFYHIFAILPHFCYFSLVAQLPWQSVWLFDEHIPLLQSASLQFLLPYSGPDYRIGIVGHTASKGLTKDGYVIV